MDAITLADFKRRLTHGLPLSVEEQRALYTHATGEAIPRLRRCTECDGTGKRRLAWGNNFVACRPCHGHGYVDR
ncbi:MAG: hypothetical protein KDA60_16020 [Planctomycetales bacterium]|nr:hypothetical protein [Planctomycetales bacterium]